MEFSCRKGCRRKISTDHIVATIGTIVIGSYLLATKLAYIGLSVALSCVFCMSEPLSIREKGIDAVLAESVNQFVLFFFGVGVQSLCVVFEQYKRC